MNPGAGARPAALPGAVLVLDADQPSSLAVVRSLGRRGLRVEVASTDSNALARRSRHVARSWVYPDPLASADSFVTWLDGHVKAHAYDLVVPLTERTVVPLSHAKARFAADLIAVADPEALAQVIDKEQTLALAARLGIKVPRAEPVHDTAGAIATAARIGYPVVVKPVRSVGHRGEQRVQLNVSYAFDERDLVAQVDSALRFGTVMLQEYFAGDGIGIELIADRGEPRYLFQHRRLHEVPLTGGGSSLRVSEAPEPVLADAASRLMRALGWHGVAMVEFKRDPANGDYRLMEINGRFWGSLPLAVAAGADFPAMLHELMTQGRVGAWPAARAGTLARQLGRDIDWLEHVLRRHAPARLVTLPRPAAVIRDCLLVFSPRHHFDVQSWRDPWPGIVDVGRILVRQYRRVADQLAARRALRREQRHALALKASLRAHPDRPVQVLFLCYGNINRSALAHAYAAQQYGPRLQFASAGFHHPGGRPADPVMQDVAQGLGISLTGWNSHTLSAQQVEQAELILAMEISHLERLERDHPGSRSKACLLEAGASEIPDPYGQPHHLYDQVARRVQSAVDGWLRPLSEAAAHSRPATALAPKDHAP